MRTFNLPQTVDVNTINATYTSGILQIVFAKHQAAKPKQIPVQFAQKELNRFGISLVQSSVIS